MSGATIAHIVWPIKIYTVFPFSYFDVTGSSLQSTDNFFRIRIRMSFIARYVYTYEEFVFMTEAPAAQQNDSDRTKKNTDNKKN